MARYSKIAGEGEGIDGRNGRRNAEGHNPKQAVAIGLSEARKEGQVPRKSAARQKKLNQSR